MMNKKYQNLHELTNKPEVYYATNTNVDKINERMYSRNIPSESLQPNLSFRPAQTKCTFMPIIDKSEGCLTKAYALYDTTRVFNPGNTKGPWSGYMANIDNESDLRNQFFAIQQNIMAKWIPTSDDNLYKMKIKNNYINNPNKDYFNKKTISTCNSNVFEDSKTLFYNSSRHQLRENYFGNER